jgi:hypothetical protein
MTTYVSQAFIDARLVGGIQALLDAGDDPAWLEIYDGVQPEGGAPGGTPLVLILLAKPTAFAAHQLQLQAADPTGGLITTQGNATWARLRNGLGDWIMDGDVTPAEGAGPFKVTGTQPGTTLLFLGARAILGTTVIA